jgi:hypothetical protein
MRTMARGNVFSYVACAVVASGVALSLSTPLSAAPIGGGASGAASSGGSIAEPVQTGYCDELRRACLNKDALGERGMGNCAKYRAECRTGKSSSSYREYRYRSYGYRPSAPYYRRYRIWND